MDGGSPVGTEGPVRRRYPCALWDHREAVTGDAARTFAAHDQLGSVAR